MITNDHVLLVKEKLRTEEGTFRLVDYLVSYFRDVAKRGLPYPPPGKMQLIIWEILLGLEVRGEHDVRFEVFHKMLNQCHLDLLRSNSPCRHRRTPMGLCTDCGATA